SWRQFTIRQLSGISAHPESEPTSQIVASQLPELKLWVIESNTGRLPFPQLLMAEMMTGPSSAISYPSGAAAA
ncbi:MAG TPA: hypothetical protein VFC15_15775, partial [Candidatus Limnocylindrales bacterium]|nr:hypothetical protein [Candidatus Limnocylindrales bacterium]